MDYYVSKPIRSEALIKALSQCQLHSHPPSQSDPEAASHHPQLVRKAALDLDTLKTLRENMYADTPFEMAELINCYLADASKLMQAIREAIKSNNAAALSRATHDLKSSSAFFGAVELATLCQEMEASSRQGMIQDGVEKIWQLELEYQQVETALHQEMQLLSVTQS